MISRERGSKPKALWENCVTVEKVTLKQNMTKKFFIQSTQRSQNSTYRSIVQVHIKLFQGKIAQML